MILQTVTVTGDNGQRSATLTREAAELVICSIHFPTIRLNAENATEEKVWETARFLQESLDCVRGCGGDVRPYQSLISEMVQQ